MRLLRSIRGIMLQLSILQGNRIRSSLKIKDKSIKTKVRSKCKQFLGLFKKSFVTLSDNLSVPLW